MKTGNLLLAGLAAFIMASCSNSEDIIDNSIQAPVGEEAAMRVSFTVPVSGARAAESGGTEAGDLNESKITTATIVLDYGGSKRLVKNNLTLNETPNSDRDYIATTPEFVVTKGANVKVYAFINPSDALNKWIETASDLNAIAVEPQDLPASGLNYLINSIAKSENFLMSGVTTTGINIEAGKTNTATIEVNRVSAKLEEKTSATEDFVLIKPTPVYKDNNQEQTIGVRIMNHSYSNLTSNALVMSTTTNYELNRGFLQPFDGKAYRWIDKGITYCLENIQAPGTWIRTNTTNVHYKAQVYFGRNTAPTFYVKKFINSAGEEKSLIYKTWAEMVPVYGLPAIEPTTAEELKKYDITKYMNGICYYVAPIEHTGKGSTIIRNNWYQLEVTKVKDLGWPTQNTPDVDEDAKLVVTAKIKPWTIHKNNIEL